MSTKLLYFEDTYLFEAQATVREVKQIEDKTAVILDQTIFYPQGGGQPADQGTIKSDSAMFEVDMVRFIDGEVCHFGVLKEGSLTAGDAVTLKIDQARRIENAKNHSAGHFLDIAIEKLGYKLEPYRGHHFPGEAYVSYIGDLTDEDLEDIRTNLPGELAKIIAANLPVKRQMVNVSELEKYCGTTKHKVPEGKPCRVVNIEGEFGCPCGGTHLHNTGELEKIEIRKVKRKSGKLKISYSVM
jgi:Ser-tRNA(Ala) deacylase AlaX